MQTINLTGQRFGRLTVIAEAGRNSSSHRLWECRCDCGGKTIARTADLNNGNSKSCSCLRGWPKGKPGHRGEQNSVHRLTEHDVREIRKSSLTQRELARLFNVAQGTIWYVRTYRTWQHVA